MMAIQMETYKSDFMSERSDRENAMGRIMELEKELVSLKRVCSLSSKSRACDFLRSGFVGFTNEVCDFVS